MVSCVHCDENSVFHRLLVTATDGDILGGLCSECENVIFGHTFDNEMWRKSEGCSYCGSRPHVNAPLLQCHIERIGASDEYEFDSPSEAPGLCRNHLESLLSEVTEETEIESHKATV